MDWIGETCGWTSLSNPRAGLGSTPNSKIGDELVIIDSVTSKGEIRLEGQVRGDVHCHSLVVGEKSQIEGNVGADDVAIRGSNVGSVRALRVVLHPQGHVDDDLFHHSLTIAQGAYFDGEARRFDDPLSLSQRTGSTRYSRMPAGGRASSTADAL